MMSYAPRTSQYVNSYKEQDIMMASPEKCILHLYDIAIQGCVNQQNDQARKAVSTLIDALDFKAGGELALRFFGLYEFSLRMIHQKNYETPKTILLGLREAWQQAMAAKQKAA